MLGTGQCSENRLTKEGEALNKYIPRGGMLGPQTRNRFRGLDSRITTSTPLNNLEMVQETC